MYIAWLGMTLATLAFFAKEFKIQSQILAPAHGSFFGRGSLKNKILQAKRVDHFADFARGVIALQDRIPRGQS